MNQNTNTWPTEPTICALLRDVGPLRRELDPKTANQVIEYGPPKYEVTLLPAGVVRIVDTAARSVWFILLRDVDYLKA